ncbi:anthranilate phosphoribosyltransferase, chloroplastic [Arabidopsis lyrata subsp. lyrata]|uniref:anthranilate phosphoribosyltransferase, chloroplastic n=1 Tax=Arabidopsis lyrata subsp. lyrata TaxID=81972 RepID=UPI000A29CB3B|nr:anthranilate phosphoribosyltransferase, chloroplastic [Arabidopsis lyrata subsp. lyrata]|eukprot:XP_020883598.1 anthranilate phosphoribosyltransferase, chloroplastic [Arabidopsis lyrata subsp. lyrata]
MFFKFHLYGLDLSDTLIETLIDRVDLSEAEAESSLEFLLNEANEALISAFLVLLRAKGETYEEIVGLARAMMKHARKVEGLVDAVDIVGIGGDGANTVNISTGSSILAAACGAKVAKRFEQKSQDSESLPLVPTTKTFLRRFIQAAQASHKVIPDMEMEFLANQVINVFT